MSEQYISMAEVKELLNEANEKRTTELSTIQKSALQHAQTMKLSKEQADELIKEVSALEFTTDATSCKIADILPKYPEDVRAIFSKERIALEADDINKVIDIVAKYI